MKKRLSQEDFEIFANDDSAVEFAMENLLIRWGVKIKAGDNSALDSMSLFARMVLQRIFNLANGGSEPAAKEFYKIIASNVVPFDEFSHRNAAFFEPIARQRTSWPGFISCDKDIQKRNDELRAKLKLGFDSTLNFKGKQWSRDTPETAVALHLWKVVNGWREEWLNRKAQKKLINDDWKVMNARAGRPASYRPTLPKPKPTPPEMAKEFRLYDESRKLARNLRPLNRQNYTQWFEAAKPLFIARYRKDFENRKTFSQHWKNSAFKEDPKARAQIRSLIKKQIKQAFRSIAPKSSAVE